MEQQTYSDGFRDGKDKSCNEIARQLSAISEKFADDPDIPPDYIKVVLLVFSKCINIVKEVQNEQHG